MPSKRFQDRQQPERPGATAYSLRSLRLRPGDEVDSTSSSSQLRDALRYLPNRQHGNAPSRDNENNRTASASLGQMRPPNGRKLISAMKKQPTPANKSKVHFSNTSSGLPSPLTSASSPKRSSGEQPPWDKSSKRAKTAVPVSSHPDVDAGDITTSIFDVSKALTLKEMCTLFDFLKGQLRRFSNDNFAFELDGSQIQAWPLHKLNTDYSALLRTTQYIADGSQHTWRTFLTSADTRPHLVYGIIGEWIKQHVFAATAFGMSSAEIQTLEDLDREFVFYDAFVRAKHRANLLAKQLRAKSKMMEEHDLQVAISTLAEKILQVLEPLTPTFMAAAASSASAESYSPMAASQRMSTHSRIRLGLEDLIHLAAKIHRGIRLAGRDGTVVRLANHPTRGDRFTQFSPHNCVNKAQCNRTQDAPHADELQIKMTCFSRTEAVQPFGPDQLELETNFSVGRKLRASRQTGTEQDEQDDEDEDDDKDVPLDESLWPILPDRLQSDPEGYNPHDPRASDAQTVHPNPHKRGSYVILTQLTPADVYLEWSPRRPSTASSPIPQPQLLSTAVAHARRARNLHRLDALRRLASSTRPYAEWLALLLCVAYLSGVSVPDLHHSVPQLLPLHLPKAALQRVLRQAGGNTRLGPALAAAASALVQRVIIRR